MKTDTSVTEQARAPRRLVSIGSAIELAANPTYTTIDVTEVETTNGTRPRAKMAGLNQPGTDSRRVPHVGQQGSQQLEGRTSRALPVRRRAEAIPSLLAVPRASETRARMEDRPQSRTLIGAAIATLLVSAWVKSGASSPISFHDWLAADRHLKLRADWMSHARIPRIRPR